MSRIFLKVCKFNIVFIFLIISSQSLLNAQVLLDGSFNARVAGLGNILSIQNGNYALGANQAGMTSLESFSANAYFERRFLSQELNVLGFGAALPVKSGVFGISVRHLGFDLWQEQMAGISYARKLAKNLSLGAQIDFYNLDLQEYGSQQTFTFELGLQLEASENLILGFYTVNPVRSKLAEDAYLPAFLALGAAYQLNKSLSLMAEIQQNLDENTYVKAGLAYKIIDDLEARLGFQSKPSLFSFGLAYMTKFDLGLEMSVIYHQVLGLTPAIGVVYNGEKDN
ncbi:MAG: hypothetical protein R2784_11585 [Saprospiraceae bacterium]